MTGSAWLAILAVLLCAISILPGTLGILMWTNRLAAQASGARLIYQHTRILLGVAFLCLFVAWALAVRNNSVSSVVIGSSFVFAGLVAYGFLMHTRLLFRPIRQPTFIPTGEAVRQFGNDEEVVGIIDPEGQPYAFIARLARRPHIVHQPEGPAPFVMTHCILSHSSMAYENSAGFDRPDLMITAAIANNMVFYDRTNRCSITQLHNASRDGSLALKTLPTVMMSLGTWARLYPDSRVWVRPKTWRDVFYLKVLSRADVIDPSSPVLIYSLMNGPDTRLPLKSLVLGVEIDGEERAYPLSELGDSALVHDELGNTPLLVLTAFDGDYTQVFSREIRAGEILTFARPEGADHLTDDQTGSSWDLTGKCTAGEYEGSRLKPVPHYNKIFWFAWADYHPATEVYTAQPEDGGPSQEASADMTASG